MRPSCLRPCSPEAASGGVGPARRAVPGVIGEGPRHPSRRRPERSAAGPARTSVLSWRRGGSDHGQVMTRTGPRRPNSPPTPLVLTERFARRTTQDLARNLEAVGLLIQAIVVTNTALLQE